MLRAESTHCNGKSNKRTKHLSIASIVLNGRKTKSREQTRIKKTFHGYKRGESRLSASSKDLLSSHSCSAYWQLDVHIWASKCDICCNVKSIKTDTTEPEVFLDKRVHETRQTERENMRGGATKKREISRTLLSINLHFSVYIKKSSLYLILELNLM